MPTIPASKKDILMNIAQPGNLTLAYFISPHGFGHAARASAVMGAIQERSSGIRFEIFTTVPQWFFEESLSGPFSYHALLNDVGLVQEGPLCADLSGTVAFLDEFLPFNLRQLEDLAEKVTRLKCAMVFCDISPMGIAVAREAGVPSVLVENFTWDWVYREYVLEEAGFKPHMAYLESLFLSADFHIQTAPVCSKGTVHLATGPVSRKAGKDRLQVREKLQIPEQAPLVLITMGGIPKDHGFIGQLASQKGIFYVAPGAGTDFRPSENVILLPHHSDFYHPDLVHSADAVVGKVGYSTLAEVYHAGVPFGYIKRTRFQESEILSRYIEDHMTGYSIDERVFETGDWIHRIQELLDLPHFPGEEPNGADQVSNFILTLLDEASE
jgi:hypothetical protein